MILIGETGMPYKSITELPASVRNNLPEGAQRIYMAAFNAGLRKFNNDEGRAATYAWGAVKRVYHKVGDRWVKRNSLDLEDEEDLEILEIIADNIESLQLTTGDITNIMPKRFWEVRVRNGFRVSPHTGKMLWDGTMSTFSSESNLDDYLDKPLHLIEDTVSYGTIRLKKSITKDDEYPEFHVYEVDWLKKFPGPLPLKVRRKEYGIINRGDYSFKMLSTIDNMDLLYMHSYCHTGHNMTIKPFHDLVVDEIKDRGLSHPIYSPMDTGDFEIKPSDVTQPESDTTDNDTITIEQFLDMLPEQFSIEAPPPKIWLSGNIVNKGSTTISEGIDIVIGQDNVDPRLIERFVNNIQDSRVRSSVRIVFDINGPSTGYSVPLYRDSYQKLSYKDTLDPMDFLKYTISKSQPYTDVQELWNTWAGVRIEDGIVVEKKYNGIPVSVHYSPGQYTFIRSYKTPIKVIPHIEQELSKIDRPFVAVGQYVYYNCNNIKVNKIEELCKAVQSADKSPPWNQSDCAVLHLQEIVYVDDKSLHNLSYRDRIEIMDSLIPDEFIYVRKVPYTIVKSKIELDSAIEQLSRLPGYRGLTLKEVHATFNFSGKSSQLVNLSGDIDVAIIKLQDCNMVHIDTVCPLYNITHQSLSKVRIEELKYPVKCQLASLMKCPLVKDYYYQLSEPIEVRNWSIPLSELESSDNHTQPGQSNQPYSSYKGNGGPS